MPMRIVIAIIIAIVMTSCLREDPDAIEPVNPRSWEYLDRSDGLIDNWVLEIYPDGKDDYWFGTANGLSHYEGNDVTNYSSNDFLLDDFITGIGRDRDGNLWIGTGFGASIYDGASWFYLETLSEFPFQITDIVEKNNGDLVFGTNNLGLIIYDGEGFVQLFDNQCNDCNIINVVFEDSEENIWVGSIQDLKKYDEDFRLEETFSITNELAGNDVRAVFEDRKGRIWVGFFDSGKITALSDDMGENVTLIADIEGLAITSFGNGPDNSLLVGSLVLDLIQYDGVIIRSIEEAGRDINVFTIQNHDEKILIGTSEGVSILTLY